METKRLNNTGHQNSSYLPMFDVSWLSRYPDENERVFVGGVHTIRVQSVRIVDTNKNYADIFTAAFILDAMVSDAKLYDYYMDITSNHIEMVNAFTNNFEETISSCDPYIASMITSYIRRKKYIVINLWGLAWMDKKYKAVYDKIIDEDVKAERYRKLYHYHTDKCDVTNIKSRMNLISYDIFKIFPNVEDIMIKTESPNHGDALPFNMYYFLEIISSSTTWKRINIQQRMLRSVGKEDESWIFELWSKSSDKLIQEFEKKRFNIKFETRKEELKLVSGDISRVFFSILKIERFSD